MATQGKGWGKSLLGVFVELPPEDTDAVPQTQAAPTVKHLAPMTQMSTAPSVDQDILQLLQNKVNSRRTPFTSLLEASEKLRPFIPDDITRLKAAAANNGGDKSAILSAIDVHVNDLDAEAGNFKRFTDNEARTKVQAFTVDADTRENDASQAEQRINQLSTEIQQLQQRVNDQRNAAVTARQNATSEQSELDRKVSAFNLALTTAKNSLAQQKQVLTTQL